MEYKSGIVSRGVVMHCFGYSIDLILLWDTDEYDNATFHSAHVLGYFPLIAWKILWGNWKLFRLLLHARHVFS